MSFNVYRENKIHAKISESTVVYRVSDQHLENIFQLIINSTIRKYTLFSKHNTHIKYSNHILRTTIALRLSKMIAKVECHKAPYTTWTKHK